MSAKPRESRNNSMLGRPSQESFMLAIEYSFTCLVMFVAKLGSFPDLSMAHTESWN
jgi:hypothetical protein